MKTYQLVQYGLVIMEAIAFLIAVFHWQKVKNSYWKWFVVYLGIIVLSEIAGLTLLYHFKLVWSSRNLYTYFVIPLEFLFFFWLYFRYYENRSARYWPLVGAVIYAVAALVNFIFYPHTNIGLFPFSYMLGIILVLALAILFFYQLMVGNELLGFKYNTMFWVSLGLLIFYLVSSPYFGLRQLLYAKYRDIFWIYYYIQFGVNYLMYIFFCIAFIWGKAR